MRVSMKYNGIPTACEAFPYGQVEDYTVKLALVLLTLLSNSSNIFNPFNNTNDDKFILDRIH
jgi:hypothetical protein